MTHRKPIRLATLVAVPVLALFAVGAAFAEGNGQPVGADDQLISASGTGCSTNSWRVRADSPLDTNSRALVASVCPGGDYLDINTNHSEELNPTHGIVVGRLKNISFEYRTASAPRPGDVYIILQDDLSTDPFLILDPTSCSAPIGDGTWSRADFTGTTKADACTITSDDGPWTSDGTHSALQAYNRVRPGVHVLHADLVLGNSGNTSVTYQLDRIALGTNLLYNFSNTSAVNCGNLEPRC